MGDFDGFKRDDFLGITGTHWRKELGPDLIGVLGSEYKAWPVYRRQTIHIGPARDEQPGEEYAKFFVSTGRDDDDEECGLTYGLYLETDARAAAAPFVHWRNFRDGLVEGGKIRTALADVMAREKLSIARYSGGESFELRWEVEQRDGGLHWSEGPSHGPATIDTVIDQIAVLPDDEWVNLYVFAWLPMAEAIALRSEMADRVGMVLRHLVPLYFQITSR